MVMRKKIKAKEKLLKGSSSFPLVAKSIKSKTVIRGFYSSTNLLSGKSNKKMKRLISRGTPKKKTPENQGRNLRNYRLQNEHARRVGDIFDFIPKRCVRPIFGSIPKTEAPGKLGGFSSTYKKCTISNPVENTCSSVCTPENGIGTRHIDVIVRIRPKNKQEEISKTVVWRTTNSSLIFDPKEKTSEFYFKGKRQYVRNDFGRKRPNKDLPFGFDYVYGPESSNQEIFDISLKKLVDQVLDGFNCTIFAYGATGSGKTYTMLGSSDTPGICVLMAEELYRRLEEMNEEYMTEVAVSYLEVYNETIKDLLKPDKELFIREDGKKGIIIPDLSTHTPRGPQELLKLLKTGNNARSQHATDLNAESSRSHAVFQILVVLRQKCETEKFKVRTTTSRLFMVDLAGSEKGITNGVDGLRQREGANINKSLLALSNCINALADGKPHIPYRNSKLTRLLKDSLSGNCVTVMIANVSPSDVAFEDTHNTLHYANRAKNIKITCKQNCFSEELIDHECNKVQISELQDQIKYLTDQLELERNKQQSMKDYQMGKGDGISASGGTLPEHETNIGRPLSVIHNPEALDNFLELMKRKTKLMEEFTESSVEIRSHEWEMNWKKLRVDVADFLGKLDVSDPHFITLAKLKNTQSNLSAQYPNLISTADETKEKLVVINNEIENVYQTYLNSLKSNQPFLTVTFQEFISHKKLETDMVRMEKLNKFQQNMNQTLVQDLINTEIHLIHAMKFIQHLQSHVKENNLLTPELQEYFLTILAPAYGCDHRLEPPKQAGRKCSILEDVSNLLKTIVRPLLNLPNNEPELVGSSATILLQKESSELTQSINISQDILLDTTSKDTYEESSAEENHYPFPSNSQGIKETNFDHHHQQENTQPHQEEVFLKTASATTSTDESFDDSSAESTSEDLEKGDFTILKEESQDKFQIKAKKPLGSITSRVSPGSSFLRNESSDLYIEGGFQSDNEYHVKAQSGDKIIRARKRTILLHSGRAMTDITDEIVAVPLNSSMGQKGYDLSKQVKITSKPPMVPTPRVHPIRAAERDLLNNRNPTYSFNYKETANNTTNSFEQ